MMRRSFLNGISMLAGASILPPMQDSLADDRTYWVTSLTKITLPVLNHLSKGLLRKKMPVEAVAGAGQERKNYTHLEAFGRSIAGLAPWLELGVDPSGEGQMRQRFLQLALASFDHAVDPASPDHMNFNNGAQPLVDAAFLAHALIRAPKHLWANLDRKTQVRLLDALRSTRVIKPYFSNWLLFTAMVEAALLKFGKDYDAVRVDYALRQHEAWYKGDGLYGDGPDFHFDYYNSFVIQPMLLDIVRTIAEETKIASDLQRTVLQRAQRYGEIQERLVSPEGTFPPVGRSIAYRCGAFQLLAQLALQKQLPASLAPAQVRSALTAVIHRTMEATDTFDDAGWLTIGLSGHQPEVGEGYISTGSLYLCTTAYLPLGLPGSDEFWSAPSLDWTSKKAFAGKPFPIDKALKSD